MRRLLRLRLVHAGAWTLATGAAVTLSWFGVHTVLAGTSYDPPRALPLQDAPPARADPQSSSTHRPKPPSPTPSPPREASKPPTGEGERKSPPRRKPSPTPTRSQDRPAPPTPSTGTVKGTTVPGGRAVFDMGGESATLVSATPDSGWDMKVWSSSYWIRVTFTNGDTSSSVFCRWDDSAEPRIETYRG